MEKEKSIKILQDVLDYLEMNPKQLSDSIGKSRPQWAYDVQNPKKKVGISKDIARRISEKYPEINESFLLTGEGELLSKTINKHVESDAEPIVPDYVKFVPLVGQYAMAGYLSGYSDPGYMDTLPKLPFIIDHEAEGDYVAFEVRGDSMDDGTDQAYKNGDKLLCREVYRHLWCDSLLHFTKWDFVIVHEEGILIKRIIAHDVKNGTITIHSLNDYYPDRVISLTEVKKIFNVVEMMRQRRR